MVSIISVFMWRNHFPKLNITFPSEVLVLSDKRPYRNLTFHNVLARQGSSYCNSARLNFQAFALRDMKIATLDSPVPELAFLPAPYRGWTRAGERGVQDNLHTHAQNEPIKNYQACVSQKTRKLLGPEDFSELFSGEFLGSRKAFLNGPENTPDSHPSFSGCFLGFAARAWQGCTELGSSRTLQIKPSFVDSFVESQANFWLFLSFVQFQHRLPVLWLIVIKNLRKVWCKY